MKLSSRKQLLYEADIELKKISEKISNNRIVVEDDSYHQKLDMMIQQLYKKAKKIKSMRQTNEDETSLKSKYALKNLPPTNDPNELKKRNRKKNWEILNQKLINGFIDYISADAYGDILLKFDGGTHSKIFGYTPSGQEEIYNADTLEPIPSVINPGSTMRFSEWNKNRQTKEENIRNEKRKGIGGIILDILDELWVSMGS